MAYKFAIVFVLLFSYNLTEILGFLNVSDLIFFVSFFDQAKKEKN
jgi:hypothetical protein